MTIATAIFYWIGVTVAIFGGVGLAAALAVWATNQVLEATRYGDVIQRWYFDQLQAQRRKSGEVDK